MQIRLVVPSPRETDPCDKIQQIRIPPFALLPRTTNCCASIVTGEPAENVFSNETTAVLFIGSRAQVVRTKGLCDVDDQGCGKVHAFGECKAKLVSMRLVHVLCPRRGIKAGHVLGVIFLSDCDVARYVDFL